MKKVLLIAALVGLSTVATSTFADVQNIRLSGDVRVRGYFLNDANSVAPVNSRDTTFIEQRTRVKIEADLEDHVLVVVSFKAEGFWGSGQQGYDAMGTANDRSWAVGVTEAYVQFTEMFYSAATLRVGRQYLNYGHGLILSSVDQVYNYDAGRLVFDFYPITLDLVGAKVTDSTTGTSFAPSPNLSHGGTDMMFLNARYETKNSTLKDVEAYFGWLAQSSSTVGPSPWILGLRGDLAPSKNLSVWFEGVYEGGSSGATFSGDNLTAGLFNIGAKYATGKSVPMSPTINANYIFATGGGSAGVNNQNAFQPWFSVADGYNGYLFCPSLSNIHIFNLGASIKPVQNVTVALQWYYYLKADNDTKAGSNANIDFGGLSGISAYQTSKSELGQEIDLIVGYDYSKDVRFQIVGAAFIPGRAFTDATPANSVGGSSLAAGNSIDRTATELRGEINVKF